MKHLNWFGRGIALVATVATVACSSSATDLANAPLIPADGTPVNGYPSRALRAMVGQEVDIKVQTIGPGEFGTPLLSNTALQFVSVADMLPYNPGGPTQLFRFQAAARGTTIVTLRNTSGGGVIDTVVVQ